MNDTKNLKSFYISTFVLGIILFVIPYFWRRYRDNDIKNHSLYTMGRIFKRTSSLKNGRHWHYEFEYNKQVYTDYRSTHVDYKVGIGDWFLVNFSSRDPSHSKILYDYKLKFYRPDLVHQVWTEIPDSILVSGRK